MDQHSFDPVLLSGLAKGIDHLPVKGPGLPLTLVLGEYLDGSAAYLATIGRTIPQTPGNRDMGT